MYGDSHALSSDSIPISASNPNQQEEEQHFHLMESDYRNSISSSQNTTGLLRFRSAPTSLLANFAERGSSKLGFSRFCSDEANGVNVAENEEGEDDDDGCYGNNNGSCNRLGGVNSQLPPQYPRQSGAQLGHRVVLPNQGLMRQNSSPAGLFSHLNPHNGYSGVRGIGSYRVAGNGDLSPSPNRFKNHMNFSPASPSSLGTLSRISEFENDNEAKVGNATGDDSLSFSSGFPFGSWNDSSYFAESMIKREVDNDPSVFLDTERCEGGNIRPNILSHHLSLPKSSPSEIAAMEKLLQLQDTVPCKVRAKRGCATHPRSIAERVRRTRISERMRKLQELVPNMDKQTNTSDMLDLAVEYIKNLQKHHKTLNDVRANCKCSAFNRKY